jgi:hypothetical protein
MQDSELRSTVEAVVNRTPVFDIHTHLYPPAFGALSLWGIDELVAYHYLIAELFRFSSIRPNQFWALSKPEQADLIWRVLFVENTPISEACKGVICVLKSLGLDPAARDLGEARKFYASRKLENHIEDVFRLSNATTAVMTNDVFNPEEAAVWARGFSGHFRFRAALRMDPLINSWRLARPTLENAGHNTDDNLSEQSVTSARRFLDSWIEKMQPMYMAVSLPPNFAYPDDTSRTRVLREVVLPTARAHRLPFAMMIGVRKQINPALKDAGDGVGPADVSALIRMCQEAPDVRFLVTMLSRENQHELCVTARKFANLMVFGCWWFLNNPSIIREITFERIELLGSSFIPQHSDCRILEQMIYKWAHSRRILADVLFHNYAGLQHDGRQVSETDIERDVTKLLSKNFETFVNA